jgi:hypothetical protein
MLAIVVIRPHCSDCDRQIKEAEISIHIASTTNGAPSLGTWTRNFNNLLPPRSVGARRTQREQLDQFYRVERMVRRCDHRNERASMIREAERGLSASCRS